MVLAIHGVLFMSMRRILSAAVRATDVLPAAPCFQLQQLEARKLLTTPSALRPETLGDALDLTERQAILDRFDNADAGVIAQLSGRVGNAASFDSYLNGYMQWRDDVGLGGTFFFDAGDVDSYAAFVAANNVDHSGYVANADILYDHRFFPLTGSTSSYDVRLEGDFSWLNPHYQPSYDFAVTLNSHTHWTTLAQTYRLTGESKYAEELAWQMADWSDEVRTLETPASWTPYQQSGWAFSNASRTDNWIWTWQMMLGSADFSTASNTLMVYKLIQFGDQLYADALQQMATTDLTSNRTLTLGRSLLQLAQVLPEVDTAATWEATGRQMMFDAMDAQFYADGTHYEQSPGYALGSVDNLLEAYWLDKLNGDAGRWDSARVQRLKNAAESFRQLLTPDGKRPAMGDTFRVNSATLWLKKGIVLGEISLKYASITGVDAVNGLTTPTMQVSHIGRFAVGDQVSVAGNREMLFVTAVDAGTNTITVNRGFAGSNPAGLEVGDTLINYGDKPFAKPRMRDIWVLGPGWIQDFMDVPVNGALGERGTSYAMPDSGNYVLRSGSDENATQILFDAGPRGGYHGHSDLFNFELFAGGRPLIMDPGAYNYLSEGQTGYEDRQWVTSTPAHNTISINGESHGDLEGADHPQITLNSWGSAFGGTMVSATHSAYGYMDGEPVVTRSMWYDHAGNMLIVDWVYATEANSYTQSFMLPGDSGPVNYGTFMMTRYNDGGKNVVIQPIAGGTSTTQASFTGSYNLGQKDSAIRYTVTKDGRYAMFATYVKVVDGRYAKPSNTATVTAGGNEGDDVVIRLDLNGAVNDITFAYPDLAVPDDNLGVQADYNDIEFDNDGNLHMVYHSRPHGGLWYTRKSADSDLWSIPQPVDLSTYYSGMWPDLEIDANGDPGVAYLEGTHGDLKYALKSTGNKGWIVQNVDVPGSTGLYPSMTYSRFSNQAIIAYYDKSARALNVAQQTGGFYNWNITQLAGEPGRDVGRWAEIKLNPNRTDLNASYVVAYEDTWNSAIYYAHFQGGWRHELVDDLTGASGGFISMGFVDSGESFDNAVGGNKWHPQVAFYASSPDLALRHVGRDRDGRWKGNWLETNGVSRRAGMYTAMEMTNDNRIDIIYFDARHGLQRRITGSPYVGWTYGLIGNGGRVGAITSLNGQTFVTNLDEAAGGKLFVLAA